MPSKKKEPAVRLIIKSGVIPENVLLQLEQWKLLPSGAAKEAGTRPVSLESGWGTAQEFVAALEKVIEEEASEVKETKLVTYPLPKGVKR